MKISSFTSLSSVLMLMSALNAHAINQVEYADMRLLAPNPTIVVTGQGDEYTKASKDKLTFKAEAKGRCTWANRYLSVHHHLRDPKHQPQHSSDFLAIKSIVNVHDGYDNKNRTWSSSMKPISLKWKPNSETRSAAVEACNSKRASMIKAGQPANGSFQTTLIDKVNSEFRFVCSTLVSATPNQVRLISKPHPITVKCEKLAPIQASLKLDAIKPLPINIGHVAVEAQPKNYTGMCPANMKFKGSINTQGPGGDLKYRFLVNGNPISGFKNITIAAGKKTTTLWGSKKLQAQNSPQQIPNNPNKGFQAQPQNGIQALPQLGMTPTEKITLEIKQGDKIRSAEDAFTLTCQQIKKAKLVLPNNGSDNNQADLIARGPLQLGSKTVAWGNAIAVNAEDATSKGPRGCKFRFAYTIANIGKADAKGFSSQLRVQGKSAHQRPNMNLASHKTKKISGTILLPAGTYPLTLTIDNGKVVTESNENNNHFQVMVTAPEQCSDRPASRPTRSSTPKQ